MRKIFKLNEATGGKLVELNRRDYKEPDYYEDYLQRKIDECPELLAIDMIDPAFGPLIPIGREKPVANGSIDNLFINHLGRITIVEVKRWRNPQSLREVLSQIIDYSKCLSGASYEEFQEYCETENLYSLVKQNSPQNVNLPDEASFIDLVSDALANSDFLLIIVGDGIRKQLEDLLEIMKQYPHLYTKFALLELQMFEDGDNILFVPSIPAESVQFNKIKIEVAHPDEFKKKISVSIDEVQREKGSRRKMTLEELFEELASYVDAPVLDRFEIIMQRFSEVGCDFESLSASVNLTFGKTGLFTFYNTGKVYLSYKYDSIFAREDLTDAKNRIFKLFPNSDGNYLGKIDEFVAHEEEIITLIEEG